MDDSTVQPEQPGNATKSNNESFVERGPLMGTSLAVTESTSHRWLIGACVVLLVVLGGLALLYMLSDDRGGDGVTDLEIPVLKIGEEMPAFVEEDAETAAEGVRNIEGELNALTTSGLDAELNSIEQELKQ